MNRQIIAAMEMRTQQHRLLMHEVNFLEAGIDQDHICSSRYSTMVFYE